MPGSRRPEDRAVAAEDGGEEAGFAGQAAGGGRGEGLPGVEVGGLEPTDEGVVGEGDHEGGVDAAGVGEPVDGVAGDELGERLPEPFRGRLPRSRCGSADRFVPFNRPVDWNCDGFIRPARVGADVNNDGRRSNLERGQNNWAYIVYDGEGHGFRRPETIVHVLETELAFLGEVFGFETPGVAPLGVVGGADD